MGYNRNMYKVEAENGVPRKAEYLSIFGRAKAACESAKLLRELQPAHARDTMQDADYTAVKTAVDTLATTGTIPNDMQDDLLSNTEVARRLGNILSAYETEVVHDALRLRRYVTNRLIEESHASKGATRLQALRMLGQITEVGLFTERIQIKGDKEEGEVVAELQEKLRKLREMGTVEEIPYKDVPPPANPQFDPYAELGLSKNDG